MRPEHVAIPPRIAGDSLIVSCLGFVIVFQQLDASLDYPGMLDHPASEVLPRLLAGGQTVRAIWSVHAALPIGLGIAAVASSAPRARQSTGALEAGRSLHDRRCQSRATLGAVFDAANMYLRNAIGELSGELASGTLDDLPAGGPARLLA